MEDCKVQYKKIMAAIDLSKYSEDTFLHAYVLAKALGAELTLLYVIDTHYMDTVERYAGVAGFDRESLLASQREESQARIEKELLSQAPDYKARVEFREGLPWEEILNAVKEEKPDLLVVGSKGHSDMAGVLFGSVAEKVQRHAACPVMTIRGPEHCRISA